MVKAASQPAVNSKKVVKKATVEAIVAKADKPVKAAAAIKKLSLPMITLTGKSNGEVAVSEEIFDVKPNKTLLAQAVRVYVNNQLGHWSNTKTRGEVDGSTRKIFKQKGTGRARHGAVRAPIFVGGGIALGPKARQTRLTMPQQMKKAALKVALTMKLKDQQAMAISDLEKASGKTKQMATLINTLGRKSVLFVTGAKQDSVVKAIRNLKTSAVVPVSQLNAYQVTRYQTVLLSVKALEALTGGNHA